MPLTAQSLLRKSPHFKDGNDDDDDDATTCGDNDNKEWIHEHVQGECHFDDLGETAACLGELAAFDNKKESSFDPENWAEHAMDCAHVLLPRTSFQGIAMNPSKLSIDSLNVCLVNSPRLFSRGRLPPMLVHASPWTKQTPKQSRLVTPRTF